MLVELGADPTISKKDMAYNLLSDYLRRKSVRQIPSSDIEIEAKLSLKRQDQHIFHQIRNDFQNGLIGRFAIPKNFPYVLEGGKLHQYLITPENNYLRISIKGKSKKIISKEDYEIISDKFGLNCIIKRKEIKEPLSSTLVTLPAKTIHRKRKYFIVENQKTKNSYCVLIDRCTYDSDELFQMEIEGLLLSSSKKNEEEIVDDIAYLTNQLIQRYDILKPTNLTKLEWLKKL